MIDLTIIGNIGADAEMKDFGDHKCISFRVAHTRKSKDGQKRTTWVSVLKYTTEESPRLLQWLTKGTQVYVEGEPSVRAWTDAQGNAQAAINLSADRIELLSSRKSDDQAQPQAAPTIHTNTQNELPYLTKGTRILVEGEPSVRAWTDKDGNARASLNISADYI